MIVRFYTRTTQRCMPGGPLSWVEERDKFRFLMSLSRNHRPTFRKSIDKFSHIANTGQSVTWIHADQRWETVRFKARCINHTAACCLSGYLSFHFSFLLSSLVFPTIALKEPVNCIKITIIYCMYVSTVVVLQPFNCSTWCNGMRQVRTLLYCSCCCAAVHAADGFCYCCCCSFAAVFFILRITILYRIIYTYEKVGIRPYKFSQ